MSYISLQIKFRMRINTGMSFNTKLEVKDDQFNQSYYQMQKKNQHYTEKSGANNQCTANQMRTTLSSNKS